MSAQPTSATTSAIPANHSNHHHRRRHHHHAVHRATLTTPQFQTAITQYLDETKPDVLATQQIQNLRVDWRQQEEDDNEEESAEITGKNRDRSSNVDVLSLKGILDLSSEYITISIYVNVTYTTWTNSSSDLVSSERDENSNANANNDDTDNAENQGNNNSEEEEGSSNNKFQSELHVQLDVSAAFVPLGDFKNKNSNKNQDNNAGDSSENKKGAKEVKNQKEDRKERALKKKLRAGMIARLRSDPTIRRLLVEENNDNNDTSNTSGDGGKKSPKPKLQTKQIKKINTPSDKLNVPLCEALIQQNTNTNELEERVDVHESSLQGIRCAILSHSDQDCLDVLGFLLSMPYLPRSKTGTTGRLEWIVNHGDGVDRDSAAGGSVTLCELGERAYLRLLEDAMFDACEKEGEDELLDDLNISDKSSKNDDDDGEEDSGEEEDNGRRGVDMRNGRGARGKSQPNAKRAKPF